MSETVEPSKQPEFDPEVQAFFQMCSKKLDEHNDRHERLVKLSRDITIESKRIIFLLHRVQDDETKLKLTAEADSKLKWVQKKYKYAYTILFDGMAVYRLFLFHRL